MTCLELQEILPEIIDGTRSAEQESHLKACSECAGLVSDLNTISQEAKALREFADPSPRVWNSLEIALRQEGLIRQPQRDRSLEHSASIFSHRWSRTWLMPVAAAVLLAAGVMLFRGDRNSTNQANTGTPAPAAATAASKAAVQNSRDDKELLSMVKETSPSMQAVYENDLQNVNAYISDAQESVDADPNDEEARQSLMDAYDQRAVVYEMAMDHSLQ